MIAIHPRLRFAVFALAIISCAPITSSAQPTPTAAGVVSDSQPDKDNYIIRPGDKLEILVWKNDQLSHTVVVKPEGRISLPLLNEVDAAGLTPLQLRERLVERFSEYVPTPEVSVIVESVADVYVSVIGEVSSPGRHPLQGPLTVLDALALSGGLSEFASRGGIKVLRSAGAAGAQSLPFNYKQAIAGDEKANFQLQAGDIVVVP